MDCPQCATPHLAHESVCVRCGGALDAAADKLREWKSLPAEARAEFERGVRENRGRLEEHLAWLRRARKRHAIGCGLAFTLLHNLALGFPSAWTLPLDFAIGAGAAVWLNAIRGGAWRGLGIFLLASALTVPALAPFVNMDAYLGGWWLLTALVGWICGALGYYWGLRWDFDRRERMVLR